MESKIDQLTMIVKSAQKMENQKSSKGKLPKQTPKKSDGPTMSAAGPFRKVKKTVPMLVLWWLGAYYS